MKFNIALVVLVFLSTTIYAKEKPAAEEMSRAEVCPDSKVYRFDSKSNRIITEGANELIAFTLGKEEDIKTAKATETERETKFQSDLDILRDSADDLKKNETSPAVEELKYICALWKTKYKRSELDIELNDKSKTYMVGPAEHLYLSADLPLENIKQLKLDSESGEPEEKEVPSSIYIGINARYGDVISNYGYSDIPNNISAKLLLKASSHPLDSVGIGIGYNFKGFEIFYARIGTLDSEDTNKSDLGRTYTNVFGVSVNISKGLKWIGDAK